MCVLGSTGYLGEQAISVIASTPSLRVVAISCQSAWQKALDQARQLGCRYVAVADPVAGMSARRAVSGGSGRPPEILVGPEGLNTVASLPEADLVFHAIPGFAGVRPLLAALKAGKRVAFAGKEALVCAGELIIPYLAVPGAIIPVDGEHSAVFQCIAGEDPSSIREIVLTASGGALRDVPIDKLKYVTPEEALKHPTWRMGKKITIDSATLFNKSLEVIEAHYLFSVPYDRIRVVIHRESIVHAMVVFSDGATKLQVARPDMRLPISYALNYPHRAQECVEPLPPVLSGMSFSEVDEDRYPCLRLGYEAGKMGGTAPCVLSAADEIAVEEFLRGRIAFTDIYRVLDGVLQSWVPARPASVEHLEEEDRRARCKAKELAARLGRP